ncbi:rta1 domain protein [Biscogniauxia mediterranea]|nr:rta1 domain protein [Biscogniauxia mediterranea]
MSNTTTATTGTETGTGHRSFRDCTEVGPYCPVEATVLGYYPNLGVNAFLAAGFGACIVGLVVTGVWKRTWGYSAALTAGCALEFAGYIARVRLSSNPWDPSAFQTQICAIVLAPTLLCIGVYVTLKHAVALCGAPPRLSRLRPPRLYPLLFVPADVACLALQAVGGGLAAAASAGDDDTDPDLLLAGDRVIVAGIALQCVVLAAFGALAADYFARVRGWLMLSRDGDGDGDGEEEEEEEEERAQVRRTWGDGRFRLFCGAVAGAYCGILIRCIYRIAEMAGGWGNPIMQDEPSFIVLEGFMILIAVVLLTAFPPGFLFPAMAEREARRFRSSSKGGKKRNRDRDGRAGEKKKKIAEKIITDEPIVVSGDEEQGQAAAARGRGLTAAEEGRGPEKVVLAETV